MTKLFLLGSASTAAWLVSLYLYPFGACPRCHGQRVVVGGTKARPKPRQCPACKGVGRRQRTGSRAVHRAVRKVRKELARQRERNKP